MHVITHSLAHRPRLFQGALSGSRFIIQSPPPLPLLQLRDLQFHLICIPHQHLYYYPLPVKPPHVISNISPNPLSQTRILRRWRINRVYSAISVWFRFFHHPAPTPDQAVKSICERWHPQNIPLFTCHIGIWHRSLLCTHSIAALLFHLNQETPSYALNCRLTNRFVDIFHIGVDPTC